MITFLMKSRCLEWILGCSIQYFCRIEIIYILDEIIFHVFIHNNIWIKFLFIIIYFLYIIIYYFIFKNLIDLLFKLDLSLLIWLHNLENFYFINCKFFNSSYKFISLFRIFFNTLRQLIAISNFWKIIGGHVAVADKSQIHPSKWW